MVISLDEGWFRNHPGRQYRLRMATPDEIDAAKLFRGEGGELRFRAVVRRSDLVVRVFIEASRHAFTDQDESLHALFANLDRSPPGWGTPEADKGFRRCENAATRGLRTDPAKRE